MSESDTDINAMLAAATEKLLALVAGMAEGVRRLQTESESHAAALNRLAALALRHEAVLRAMAGAGGEAEVN